MTWRSAALGATGVVASLALWELVSRLGIVPATSLPAASTTLARLALELSRPETWLQTASTILQMLAATVLCIVIAVPLGLVIGRFRAVDAVSRTSIDFLRAVPGLALVPLFVLFIGARPEMVILLATFVSVWPLLISTIDGARAVEPLSLEMARSFRLSRMRTFAQVILPAAAPFIVTGLRVTLNVALLVAVGAQLLVGSPGIGQQMAVANVNGDGLAIYALSIWAGILGVLMNLALRGVENKAMRWHKAATAQIGAS